MSYAFEYIKVGAIVVHKSDDRPGVVMQLFKWKRVPSSRGSVYGEQGCWSPGIITPSAPLATGSSSATTWADELVVTSVAVRFNLEPTTPWLYCVAADLLVVNEEQASLWKLAYPELCDWAPSQGV